MPSCPSCRTAAPWQLADGRHKCRQCRQRFTWTSAWDSVRIAAPHKDGLLGEFLSQVPARRARSAQAPALRTRERFYRLARACCAHAEHLRRPLEPSVAPAATGRPQVVVGLVQIAGRVRVAHIPGALQAELAARPRRPGHQAFLRFPVDGHSIVVSRADGEQVARFGHAPAEPWMALLGRLAPRRRLPLRYFHLYLAEACFRLNNVGRPLDAALRQLMQSTGVHEARATLVRN